jgi:hypothetical protein
MWDFCVMPPEGTKTHLIKAFRWSHDADSDWVAILGSALGMAVPILCGAALGDLETGFSLAIGSLMVGGIGAHESFRSQARTLVMALVPSALAAGIAVAIGGFGVWTSAAIVGVAGVAGAIGAIGLPVTPMAIRFILFLVVAVAIAEDMPDRLGLLLAMGAGALWSSAVNLLLGALARAFGHRGKEPPLPQATWRERLVRWRRALARRAGWQYPLRVTSCLAIAGLLMWLWPTHHLHWVALTVVLLAEWQIDAFPVRTTQRALGTAFGVLATGILVIEPAPAWALVTGMAALAAARPLLRTRNYLAYSVVMTPLIILILDAGKPIDIGLLIDRLIATLIGAALVIGANLLFARLLQLRPS